MQHSAEFFLHIARSPNTNVSVFVKTAKATVLQKTAIWVILPTP
jgi:hypothetical protein